MNLHSGLEHMNWVFPCTVMGTSICGIAIYASLARHLEGRGFSDQTEARRRAATMEAISSVLNDLDAVDSALVLAAQVYDQDRKQVLAQAGMSGQGPTPSSGGLAGGLTGGLTGGDKNQSQQMSISKNQFAALLAEVRKSGGSVSDAELELIFTMLDENSDGTLQRNEMRRMFEEQI